MNSRLQEAVKLNNKGVSSLLEGNHEAAVESMFQSMKLMKEEFTVGGRPQHADNESSTPTIHRAQTVEIPGGDYSSDTVVFNQVFLIPSTMMGTTPSFFDLNVAIASVIFNLALAFHNQAPGDETSATKAEKLYAMSSKLLDGSCYFSSHTALVVKLASINNLAQLQCCQGDYKLAQESLSQASWFMMQSSNQELFEEPEIRGLLMNALFFKEPVAARAA